MPGMLYYPTLIPPTPVLYHGLLYWDRIATIAPADHEKFLDHRMRQIADAELYEPVSAAEIINDRELQESIFWALNSLIMEYPPDELIPPSAKSAYELLRLPREVWERHIIRPAVKVNMAIVEELLRRRLAELDPYVPDLLWVSPKVQTCLLGITAREVAGRVWALEGCTAEAALFPHTDQPQAHLAAHSDALTPHSGEGMDRLPCWTVDISGLLPVPHGDVRISDVIAFRQRYDNERRRLMLAIDKLIHGLSEDYGHPKDVFFLVKQELENALADFEAAGRSSRLVWVRRSVCVTVAVASVYAGLKYVPDVAWLLGIVGAIAVNISTTSVRQTMAKTAVDVSYLHRLESSMPSGT
jgi:hypothetical protein